jgi:hypothetical protein
MSGAVEQARWFSYGRQQLNRAGRDPEGVLRDVVAVPSSHPSAPLALLARCEPLTPDAFRELDALRLPAMRGSIQLLSRKTAHLAFAAIAPSAQAEADALEDYGLSREEHAELRPRLLAAAIEPRTARELRQAVCTDRPLAPVLSALTREGSLVRLGAHGLRSNEVFYVAAHIPRADPEEALGWLCGEYLRAYGPARREDFAWWAGIPADRADAALAGLATEELGDGLLLLSADMAAFTRATELRGTVDLLPKADPYVMGYAPDGRGRFADPDGVAQLYDARGDGRPTVLVDGSAAGTWGVRPDGGLEFELDLFESPTPAVRAALDGRAAAIRALLS